jgi:hypothetical protein
MATTEILQITELANNQVNHNVTVNEGIAALEKATQDFLVVDLAAANEVIDIADFLRHFMFRAANNAVTRAIDFPASKRFFAVHNTGSATLTVSVGATDLSLSAAASALYYADGTADGLIKIG